MFIPGSNHCTEIENPSKGFSCLTSWANILVETLVNFEVFANSKIIRLTRYITSCGNKWKK